MPPPTPTQSDRLRLVRLIWPFVAIVLLLLAIGTTSLEVIRGIRAYLTAESVWSNAQNAAVEALEQYAQTRNEDHFDRYVAEAHVVAGARAARVELEKPFPDFDVARRGLLQARNDPADIDAMINLFRRFRPVGFMAGGVQIWTDADALFARIDALAAQIHAAIRRGRGDTAELEPALVEMRSLDRDLTALERAFAATFAATARRIESALTIVTLALGVALVLVAIVRTQRLIRKEDAFLAALRASQQRFDYVVSGTNDGIWDWSVGRRDLYCSPRFEQLLGYASATLRETAGTFLRRIHPADRRASLARLREHVLRGDPFDLELRLRVADGDYRWFRARGRSVLGERGRPQRMAGSLADISDRKRAEAQTLQEKERAQVTLASIADAVITVDTSGNVEYMNPIAERLTGFAHDEAHGQALSSVFRVQDEATGEAIADPVARARADEVAVASEGNVVLLGRHDGPIAIDYSAAPIRDRAGLIGGAVLVFHDMSRERQYATRLAHLASHDALTGLLNRREFERRVSAALREGEHGGHHAILYLDLDEFKVVNDTCGHAAGDELLRQVSALLRPRLREGDTLARLGGDEFGVLLEHCGQGPALAIADALRNAIGDFHFQWKQRSFKIGVSIGVVDVGGGRETLAGVLSAADAACYMAKDKGRNRVQRYSPESDEVAARKGEMEWVNRIHRALADNRFCLYSQPVHATHGDDGVPAYTELLLRLRGDDGELVPPTAFIPAAERYHMMPAIDRWVISTAFATLARFQRGAPGAAAETGVCAINVSGASLGDDEFLGFVEQQFVQHGIAHSRICFEITETTAVASLTKASEFMTALRRAGCQFALDDFGVGVSSFTYLKRLPVDYLKIDGSFVRDMLDDPVNRAMVEAIHRIGHIMGKKTIAESVEKRETLTALREIGVDYAQGFAIAAPAPFRRLHALPQPANRKVAGGS